jgi:hypothetical protein
MRAPHLNPQHPIHPNSHPTQSSGFKEKYMNRKQIMQWIALPVLAAGVVLTTTPAFAANPVLAQDTAKQDIKDAGHDTKEATKKTGHAIAKGTTTAARKTKNGTETAAKDTGHATKEAAVKTKEGTKKVVHSAAKGTEKTADKVEDKTQPK